MLKQHETLGSISFAKYMIQEGLFIKSFIENELLEDACSDIPYFKTDYKTKTQKFRFTQIFGRT
jgi:hypothetical protein